MLVIATAPPGTLEDKDCTRLENYAKTRGVDMEFHHLGKDIFRIAKERRMNITPDNILDVDHEKLDLVRALALERIGKKISRQNRKDGERRIDILRTHAKFIWNDVPRKAWYSKDILALKPDKFVSFVDDAEKILERLSQRSQWAAQDFSLRDILYWINDEVNTTDDWADSAGKPFYVVPDIPR